MKRLSSKDRINGFTLIELLITIAIVAILAAIAIPSYRAQAIRAARTEALDQLLAQAQFQQQFYTQNNQFNGTAAFTTTSGRYQITTALANANQSYTLSAIPQGGQTDDACGTLTLTNIGVRGISGGGNLANCWAGR